MHPFSVWAPRRKSVCVEVNGSKHRMESGAHGWWHVDADAGHGTDYRFFLDDDPQGYPDPRSLWQPYDVHGASRVFDPGRFQWTDDSFRPLKLQEAIIYELHLGTFTPDGTFAAAEERLSALSELGITHVELMPLNSFPGRFGWGYDGVALYAPQEAYGGPEALQHFVNACHAHRLAVLLDVVYNHFGPVGNYTGKFGPYITESHHTPWGGAVNLEEYGSTEVRRFFCDNALMWLRDYHFDGLRLDAIQTYVDRSATHLLEQLSAEVADLSEKLDRHLVLIAESDLNDPRVVTPRKAADGTELFGYGIDAQWSDDFHHALFAFLTGQRHTYYRDFGSLEFLAKSLSSVFIFDGIYAENRGRIHGRPVFNIDRNCFLGYVQNHDQVGNQAYGDRLCSLVGMRKAKLAAAMVLTAPFVPMLFQGEEFAASSPFLYFAQHDDPIIARSVSEGRRMEHAHEGDAQSIPDPEAQSTYENSKLKWEERESGEHAEMLAWYRRLISLRRYNAALRDGNPAKTHVQFDSENQWIRMERNKVHLLFNFADHPINLPVPDGTSITLTADSTSDIVDGTIQLPGLSFAAVSVP